MKRIQYIAYIAELLACFLLLSSLTPVSVFADEDDYTELIAQRQAYFEAKYGSEDEYAVGRTWGEDYWLAPMYRGQA